MREIEIGFTQKEIIGYHFVNDYKMKTFSLLKIKFSIILGNISMGTVMLFNLEVSSKEVFKLEESGPEGTKPNSISDPLKTNTLLRLSQPCTAKFLVWKNPQNSGTNKSSVRTLYLVTKLPAFISFTRASFLAFQPLISARASSCFSCSAVSFSSINASAMPCFHKIPRFMIFSTLMENTGEKAMYDFLVWIWSYYREKLIPESRASYLQHPWLYWFWVYFSSCHPWHSIVIFIEVSICHFKPLRNLVLRFGLQL